MKWHNLLIEINPDVFKVSVALEAIGQSETKEKTYYSILEEGNWIDLFDWDMEKIQMCIDTKLESLFDCDILPMYTVLIDKKSSPIDNHVETF